MKCLTAKQRYETSLGRYGYALLFFRNHPVVTAKLDAYLQEFGFLYLSVITYYEILNGLYFKDAKTQLAAFERFAALNIVLPLTDDIAKESAKVYASLRQAGNTVGHNDVLIAGTAIANDLILISNNTHHFSRIDRLILDNWAL